MIRVANAFEIHNSVTVAVLQTRRLQIHALGSILRHFRNPLLVLCLRLGLLKLPYFLYQIRANGRAYEMLARPTTTSHADLFVLREVLVDEAYNEVLACLDNKNIRLVDVGSNLGSFVIWMNSKVGVREAFCFEPEPDSFQLLTFNLNRNRCAGAKTFNCAMGGKQRTVQIKLKQSSPGGTSIYSQQTSNQSSAATIQVLAFQSWLNEVEGNFDILKLDCEGSEWEIVSNTDIKQISRFRVCVAEVHGDPHGNRAPDEFRKLMEARGFRTLRWDNTFQGLYLGVRDSTHER